MIWRLRFSSYQFRVLFLLTMVNFVNYVDRQVLFPLVSLIQTEFLLTDQQVGLMATSFSLVYAPATLVLGWLADRTSRKKIITYGVLFWSAATFLSGLATSYPTLLVSRALVGVGEAAYTPAAMAIITAAFSRGVRATVQGVYNMGMLLGGAFGLAIGGMLGQWVGWRPAFFIVGVPGLLLALTIMKLEEPAHETRKEKMVPVKALLRVPAYVMVLVSGWFVTFAGFAYVFWGVEYVRRFKGFSLAWAGAGLGTVVMVSVILGVLAGAAVADGLARKHPGGRAAAIAGSLLVSSPLIYGALVTESRVLFLALFFVGGFFMSWYHGPLVALVHDLFPEQAHASAMGVYFFFVNLFATAVAPWAIGKISDLKDLQVAMEWALGTQVVGGLLFLGVIYFIHRDGLRHPAVADFAPGAEAVLPGGA